MEYSVNIDLTGIKRTDTYRLYHSTYVVNHRVELMKECEYLNNKLNSLYPYLPEKGREYTWEYANTNAFSLCTLSIPFYRVYQQITSSIRDWVQDDRPLWMHCWLNYNTYESILNWHDHDDHNLLHGYISIEPKNTITEFKHFTVENKTGTLYLGLPGKEMIHRVVANEKFEGYRATLAFNVMDKLPSLQDRDKLSISLMPIP